MKLVKTIIFIILAIAAILLGIFSILCIVNLIGNMLTSAGVPMSAEPLKPNDIFEIFQR